MPTSMFTWISDQKNHPQSSNHEKILAECCEQRRPCRFLMVHNGVSAKATLLSFHPNEITLLVSHKEVGSLIAQAICCVSFPHNGSYCAFLSSLLEVNEHNFDLRKVTLSVPKQLVTTNLRQSFRVPVHPEAEFEASLCVSDDQWIPVKAVDIAQTGIEVELASDDALPLVIGAIVNAELRFNGELVRHLCEVRRILGRNIGLSFMALEDEVDREKSSIISGMVISLQQVWLRNRVKN